MLIPEDETFTSLLRLRSFLRAAGRYGNSTFLVGDYGGLGEISQGFCRCVRPCYILWSDPHLRTCAVNGGVYILGHRVVSLTRQDASPRFSLALADVPDVLTADVLISSRDYLPNTVLQPLKAAAMSFQLSCAALVNFPLKLSVSKAGGVEDMEDANSPFMPDNCLIVFPPGSVPSGKSETAVRVLITGSKTMSCPSGTCLYSDT